MQKVFINGRRIEYADNRFYRLNDDTFIPSVTTVLSVYPKDYHFYEWLKNNGQNSDIIRDRAAEIGSQVHSGIERMLNGESITYTDYDLDAWEIIHRAHDFFLKHKFTDIQTEKNYITDKCQWAGTIDFIGNYNGKRWLIDFKTSNSIADTHYLQLIAYKKLAELMGEKIDKLGILHLRADTRTDKEFQVKGCKLHELTDKDIIDLTPVWDATLQIYNHKSKSIIPKIKSFKTTYKLWD